jgi:hypothetical protein
VKYYSVFGGSQGIFVPITVCVLFSPSHTLALDIMATKAPLVLDWKRGNLAEHVFNFFVVTDEMREACYSENQQVLEGCKVDSFVGTLVRQDNRCFAITIPVTRVAVRTHASPPPPPPAIVTHKHEQ